MAAVLRVAGGGASTDIWPRVHAFNTLRLAFQEAKLAIGMTGYCAQGAAALARTGLHSPDLSGCLVRIAYAFCTPLHNCCKYRCVSALLLLSPVCGPWLGCWALSAGQLAPVCAGLQLTVAAMAADEWEVRNAANMAFSSLLHRMLGFRNAFKVSSLPSPSLLLSSSSPPSKVAVIKLSRL